MNKPNPLAVLPMTVSRYLGLAVALLLLGACDPAQPVPPQAPPAAPPPAVSAPQVQGEAVPGPSPGGVLKPKPPAEPLQAAHATAAKSHPAVNVSKVAKAPLPKAKLDLRLPAEQVGKLVPGESLEETLSKPLLPPLFVEKPVKPSPFQLNGKLITNNHETDTWHSVEGAELQFEFKH